LVPDAPLKGNNIPNSQATPDNTNDTSVAAVHRDDKHTVPKLVSSKPEKDDVQSGLVNSKAPDPPGASPSQTASSTGLFRQLRQDLQSPDEAERIGSFNRAFDEAAPAEKVAILRIAFETGDPELQALAEREVIETGGQLTVEVPEDAPDGPLTTAMRSLHIRTGRINQQSGRFDSGFNVGAYGYLAYGSVTANGVIITGTAFIDNKEMPLSISLKPDNTGTLVGRAHSNNMTCPIRIGLL
jgi:hypothetical protein